MTFREFAKKHDTSESPWGWYPFGFKRPFYEVQRATCWTSMGFGLNYTREYGTLIPGKPDTWGYPGWWMITLNFGPWYFSIRREFTEYWQGAADES